MKISFPSSTRSSRTVLIAAISGSLDVRGTLEPVLGMLTNFVAKSEIQAA
jgi:hypothetical protein